MIKLKNLLLFLCLTTPLVGWAADYPNESILKELKERILEKENCLKICATIEKMEIKIKNEEVLEVDLKVHSSALTELMLPLGINQKIHNIKINNQSYSQIRKTNLGYYLAIKPGIWNINIEAEALNSWAVVTPNSPKLILGAQSQSTVNNNQDYVNLNISLNLKSNKNKNDPGVNQNKQAKIEKKIKIDPYFILERKFYFERENIRSQNILRPLFKFDGSATLTVPLLKEEKVITKLSDEIIQSIVNENKLVLSLNDNANFSWQSIIKPEDFNNLVASQDYFENWHFYLSDNWVGNFEPKIKNSHYNQLDYYAVKSWTPWPGEQLKIKIEAPQFEKGRTMAIQEEKYDTVWSGSGAKINVSAKLVNTLSADLIGEIDENLKINNIYLNGGNLNYRLEKNKLSITIPPGEHNLNIQGNYNKSAWGMVDMPKINWQVESSNIEHTLKHDGVWVLWAGGSSIHPSTLFWGIILAIAVISFYLNKTNLFPLKTIGLFLFFAGITQGFYNTNWLVLIFIYGAWLAAFGYRAKYYQFEEGKNRFLFNLYQLFLVLFSLIIVPSLFNVINSSLLQGTPNMYMIGINSHFNNIYWYGFTQSKPWILATPIWVFKTLMLLWSVWLAWTMIGLAKWMWIAFSRGGYWASASKIILKEEKV